MNRIAISALAAVLVLVLAGCTGGGEAPSSSEAEGGGESSAMAGMANPWSEVSSAQEAADGAGLDSFNVEDEYTVRDLTFFQPTFSCMEGIAQADYMGGASRLVVRKGTGMGEEELSGDYNEYGSTWAETVGDAEVTCRGFEPEIANQVTWTLGDNVYSVLCQGEGGENFGIPADEVADIVRNVY